MSAQSGNPETPHSPPSADEAWWPPLPVITGCLLGCLLPAYAYAEGFAALRGFGICSRRWAAFLFVVPSLVWLARGGSLFLVPQLLIAAVVSGLIARVRARRA